MKGIFDIHGARAICMGHTHRPFGAWDGERFHGNSGSWAPAFEDAECARPVLPRRPVLMLVTEPPATGAALGELHGGLFWWDEGELAADPMGARSRSSGPG